MPVFLLWSLPHGSHLWSFIFISTVYGATWGAFSVASIKTKTNIKLPLFYLMGKVPKDTLHVSGMAEKNGKKASSLRKLHVVFRDQVDGVTSMDTVGSN